MLKYRMTGPDKAELLDETDVPVHSVDAVPSPEGQMSVRVSIPIEMAKDIVTALRLLQTLRASNL